MKKLLTSIALLLIGIPAHAEQITGILTLGLGVAAYPIRSLEAAHEPRTYF